jgi:hypothetical protein
MFVSKFHTPCSNGLLQIATKAKSQNEKCCYSFHVAIFVPRVALTKDKYLL